MRTGTPRRRTVIVIVLAGLLASAVMAGVFAYYASPHPDGLEYVAERQGFAGAAEDSAVAGSPLADYGVTGVEDERLSVGLAGLLGIAVTAAVGFGLFLLLRAGRRNRPSTDAGTAARLPNDHG